MVFIYHPQNTLIQVRLQTTKFILTLTQVRQLHQQNWDILSIQMMKLVLLVNLLNYDKRFTENIDRGT